MTVLESEEALSAFLREFEGGTFPASQFHHGEHLAVAAYYIRGHDDAEARMRSAIRSFNVAQGGKNTDDAGYHETLTLFWLGLVRANLKADLGRLEAVREIVALFAPRRDLFRGYYSFDVVKSKEARLRWVCPDLPGPDGAFSVPVWETIRR